MGWEVPARECPISAVVEAASRADPGPGWGGRVPRVPPTEASRGPAMLKDVNGMSAVAFSLILVQSDKGAASGTSAGPF